MDTKKSYTNSTNAELLYSVIRAVQVLKYSLYSINASTIYIKRLRLRKLGHLKKTITTGLFLSR